METLNSLLRSLGEYQAVLWWIFGFSLALLVLTPVAVAWIVVKLPSDYFTNTKREPAAWLEKNPGLRPVIVIAKNAAGILLAIAGLIMLVVPGQGLLTLVVGLMLTDFPGKFRLESWLATRRPVWRSLNWLRKRAKREPLQRPKV